MLDSVQFDPLGEMHLDFFDGYLQHVTEGIASIRLARHARDRAIITNKPLYYQDIEWVGMIRLRQWLWLWLIPGIPLALLAALVTAMAVVQWRAVAQDPSFLGFFLAIVFALTLWPLVLWLARISQIQLRFAIWRCMI